MTAAVPLALARRVKWEQRLFWRNPAAAVFTFAFPLLFLVIFTAIYSDSAVHLPGGTVRFAQYYVPAIVSFGLISACYTNLAFTICVRREDGSLKRTRGTPLSPATYLAGMVGNVVVISLILTVLTIGLGLAFYGLRFPDRYLGLVVTIVTAAFCFSSLGMAVATVVPNQEAAPAIINFILFPLLFISGTFGQISDHSVLARIAAVFPIRPLIQEMVTVFDPFARGTGMVATHLGMLVLWGVAGVVVSLRRFRWEPRRT